MLPFRINLIGSRPIPLLQRPVVVQALAGYVLVLGALLVWECHRITRDILEVHRHMRLVEECHRTFARTHLNVGTVERYADELRQRLRESSATLTAVGQVMRRNHPADQIVCALASPLPEHVRLLSMDFDFSSGTLRFELAVPLEYSDAMSDTTALQRAWRLNPTLESHVSDLHEESNQQMALGPETVFLMRFAGTLKEGS